MVLEVLAGCKLYYNKYTRVFNIPYIGECTIPGNDTELSSIVSDVGRWLGSVLEAKIGLERGEEQIIGKRFRIHSFLAILGARPVGEVRVVTESGYPLTVSIALTDLTGYGLLSGEQTLISEGTNLGPVYLKDVNHIHDSGVDGQKPIPRFVVYAAEGVPRVDIDSWRLVVEGVNTTRILSYNELEEMSMELGDADFHCVTGWSVPSVKWTGIPLKSLVGSFRDWVYFESMNGYVTVMPRSEAMNSWIIVGYNGSKLDPRHGFPARVFNPSLYGWKSAKWLGRIWSSSDYIDGLWEALAYHERGRVSSIERFKVRNLDVYREGILPGVKHALNSN